MQEGSTLSQMAAVVWEALEASFPGNCFTDPWIYTP